MLKALNYGSKYSNEIFIFMLSGIIVIYLLVNLKINLLYNKRNRICFLLIVLMMLVVISRIIILDSVGFTIIKTGKYLFTLIIYIIFELLIKRWQV